MGLEKNRFKVNAKPFNIGMIIVDLFLYPFNETTNPVMTRLMSAVCDECERVAVSNGIRLPEGSMNKRVRNVARDTSANISSMLQDVRNGRQTEVAQINGAFCEFGRRKGVPTPLNSALVAMVTALGTLEVVGKG